MPKNGKTLAFDFDGVVHQYDHWTGASNIPNPPVDGIGQLFEKLTSEGYEIIIHSSRAADEKGLQAMKRWLYKYGLYRLVSNITPCKPAAIAYIDDRAVRFDGDCEKCLKDIHDMDENKPWYKRVTDTGSV